MHCTATKLHLAWHERKAVKRLCDHYLLHLALVIQVWIIYNCEGRLTSPLIIFGEVNFRSQRLKFSGVFENLLRRKGAKMFTLTFIFLLILFCACSFAQDSDEFLDLTLSDSYQTSQPGDYPDPEDENSCPEKLHASWLLRPPFVTMPYRGGSRNGSAVQIGGILHGVLDLSLSKCCAILSAGNKTAIEYKFQAADNRSMLHKDILHKEADLILPVQSDDKDKYKSYLPYLKILKSPGIVLIQRSDSQYRVSKNILLWNAVSSCWPIVVLTLSLSLIAGMCVWAMVSDSNMSNNKLTRTPLV